MDPRTRGELESMVLASVLVRGVPAILELKGPVRSLLQGQRLHAYDAVRDLAQRGEVGPAEVPLDLVQAEVRRVAGEKQAGDVRAVCDAAVAVHGKDMTRPGRAELALGRLADLDLEAEQPGPSTAGRTRLLSVADIFAPLPPVPWLLQALDVAPGAPALWAGYGFSGKTVTAQALALAIASGTNAWGRFPVRAGRVLHLDYEQGAYLTRSRYQRLAAALGLDPRSLDGRLVLAPMPGWYLDSDTNDECARLAEGFDLMIVDSFRAACPITDENSSEARVPLDRLTRVSEKTGVTALVIHHARKPSQNAAGGARMSVRGSGALYDACGSVLVFSGEKGEPVTVEHEKARISGRPHDAFQLWIEDVEAAGDPRGGLRVSALSTPPPASQSASQRLRELQERVLGHVEALGGTSGGVNIITRHLGARRADVSDAVAELVRAGRLVRGGSRLEPTLTMSGTT